jgi:hypothetical protein
MQDPFVGHGQVKTHPFFFATPAGVHDPRCAGRPHLATSNRLAEYFSFSENIPVPRMRNFANFLAGKPTP